MLKSGIAGTLALVIAIVASVSPAPPAGEDGIKATHAGDDRVVNVEVHKKQRAGDITNLSAASGSAGDADSSSGSEASEDPCWYQPIPPVDHDSRLGGDDPSTGVLYLVSCPDAIQLGTGALVYQTEGATWVKNGDPVVPPPPDPGQVAEEAAGQMTAPDPVIHFGPDQSKVAVKVPVWLSVDDQAPMTLTVAVRGLSVTVTATLKSTTWSMGEPIDPADPSNKVPSFDCDGVGTPAPAHPDPAVTPPCGYTYQWKSLAERTGGTKTWPVTATTNWNVTWTASNGTGGALANPLTPTSTQQIAVGEWRSTLVSGAGG